MALAKQAGNSDSRLSLAWIGPRNESSPLLDRVISACEFYKIALKVDRFEEAGWDYSDLARADRIVISVRSRIEHPWQCIERMQKWENRSPPWGVVVNLWHAGSRRTGIGAVPYWQLPWYRWWDGWHAWFFPDRVRTQSRCSTAFDAISLPIDLATPPFPTNPQLIKPIDSCLGHLLIIASCALTADAWGLSAERAGWSYEVLKPDELEGKTFVRFAEKAKADAILWDDSCIDRVPRDSTRDRNFAGECLAKNPGCIAIIRATELFPNIALIAALSVGHVYAWADFKRLGATDFIVKPSFGLPLTDYLSSRLVASSYACLQT